MSWPKETWRLNRSISSQVTLVAFVLALLLFSIPAFVVAQKKPRTVIGKPNQAGRVNELAKLREEFIKATNDYRASLEKLRASYGKNVATADTRLAQSKELFEQGLLSKNDVAAAKRAAAEARDKVTETTQRIATADSQIASTLLEADAERKLAKTRIPRGGTLRTASFVRFNGGAAWVLSDAWKVQRFFLEAFKRPLPITVFGQGPIHDQWRLDHRNSMDVSLHPDGPEGQALLNFLRLNGIAFLAFREAIPGTATGPHIHVGRPSHRY